MRIGEQIKELREAKNYSREDLSKILNISAQSIFNYETERRQITIDVLINIYNFFEVPIESFFYNKRYNSNLNDEIRNIKKIPIIPNYIDFLLDSKMGITDWIELSDNIAYDVDFATFVSDNSMEPYFYTGNLVLVKNTDNLKNGDIGIFKLNNDILIKKYYYNPFTKTVSLNSLNSAYPPLKINNDDSFKIIGKIVTNIQYHL